MTYRSQNSAPAYPKFDGNRDKAMAYVDHMETVFKGLNVTNVITGAFHGAPPVKPLQGALDAEQYRMPFLSGPTTSTPGRNKT